MSEKENQKPDLTMPLSMASDEAVLTEMIRRSSSSELHALLIAACRPDEGSTIKIQVNMLAGSLHALDLLMSSIKDAYNKRKLELKVSAAKEESSSVRKAIPRQL